MAHNHKRGDVTPPRIRSLNYQHFLHASSIAGNLLTGGSIESLPTPRASKPSYYGYVRAMNASLTHLERSHDLVVPDFLVLLEQHLHYGRLGALYEEVKNFIESEGTLVLLDRCFALRVPADHRHVAVTRLHAPDGLCNMPTLCQHVRYYRTVEGRRSEIRCKIISVIGVVKSPCLALSYGVCILQSSCLSLSF